MTMFTHQLPTDRHSAVKLLLKIAIALSILSSPAHAATQGKLGYSSSAEIAISLTIHSLIQVSGVQVNGERMAMRPEQVQQAERVGASGNADDHATACRQQVFTFQQSQQRVPRFWL